MDFQLHIHTTRLLILTRNSLSQEYCHTAICLLYSLFIKFHYSHLPGTILTDGCTVVQLVECSV